MAGKYQSYQEYKSSDGNWQGLIPSHWISVPLKRVCKLSTGLTPPTSNESNYVDYDSKLPWVRPEDLNEGSNPTKASKFLSQNGWELMRVVPKESTLICCIGTIGKSGYVQAAVSTNQQITSASFHYSPKFNYYLVLAAREVMEETATGNVIQILNSERLGGIPFLSVPQREADKIANFLDHETAKIDTLIEKQQQLIALLKEKRQAVISHAVTKGLNANAPMSDSGVEWLGEVPEHWNVQRINLLFSENSDRARTKNELEYPVLSISIHHGISDKELNEEESDRKLQRSEDRSLYKVVHSNYLAYNMMRAWQGGFGASKLSGLVSPAYVVCEPKTQLNSYYFELALRTSNAVTELKRFSRGITDFRLRLYWDEFKNISVPVPPEKEIADILKSILDINSTYDNLGNVAEQQIKLLQERRTALISAAVTGKIDVRNFNIKDGNVA
ncbi:Type I restriction-modification system, S subunit [Oleispira antarctica RB-8]|uniref:Type I restriction-modification system, S subunit n=1 Tax=Oleispira antarctica RB-8 TaxID=698738 RepID=R4YN55_OLEAN|nr:Type I restriction-modification system, S subunit [Oleispira antarctica RB-8]